MLIWDVMGDCHRNTPQYLLQRLNGSLQLMTLYEKPLLIPKISTYLHHSMSWKKGSAIFWGRKKLNAGRLDLFGTYSVHLDHRDRH